MEKSTLALQKDSKAYLDAMRGTSFLYLWLSGCRSARESRCSCILVTATVHNLLVGGHKLMRL